MRESSLYSSFLHSYHLSSSKRYMISNLLVRSNNFTYLSFKFYRNLTNRETVEIASLISSVERCNFREGRWNICVWSPNPSQTYTCKSFFSPLLDPSPPKESVFYVVWRTKVPKKFKFFIWQVFLGQINIVDRLVRRRTSLVGPFCCMLCQKAKENLDHLFGIASMHELCTAFFCRSPMLTMTIRAFVQRSRSFSSIRPSEKRGDFYGLQGCMLFMRYLGGKNNRVFRGRERDHSEV